MTSASGLDLGLDVRRSHRSLLAAAALAVTAVTAACASGGQTEVTEAEIVRYPEVAEKDLGIAFALNASAPVRASDPTPDGPLFSQGWYNAVSRAFRSTDVGTALETESRYEDWQLISMRVAPCSALGNSPSANVDSLCWPEVRLVWQPVIHDVTIHARRSESFADDRAFHALYDVPATLALNTTEASRAATLLQQVRASSEAWRGGAFTPLGAPDLAEFESLRNRVVGDLLTRVRAMRDPALPQAAFRGLGVRPESDGSNASQSAFRSRVLTFLGEVARPPRLKALTAFSLPEGREPAQLDSWIFLAFRAQSGSVSQEDIKLVSRNDGRTIVNVGRAVSATTGSDDEAFLASSDSEVRDSIILGGADIARLKPVIRDRRQRLVPNTGCASCHQLNDLRFDFHNFGYFEDRDLTIAPRVETDVALDLAWLTRP